MEQLTPTTLAETAKKLQYSTGRFVLSIGLNLPDYVWTKPFFVEFGQLFLRERSFRSLSIIAPIDHLRVRYFARKKRSDNGFYGDSSKTQDPDDIGR